MIATQSRTLTSVAAVIALLVVLGIARSEAQSFSVIHTFTGGTDGSLPQGFISGPGGNFYGSTYAGVHGYGGIYELKHAGSGWTFSPLYGFAGGSDGANPGYIVFGPDGSLYGDTQAGGNMNCNSNSGCGILFKLSPPLSFCHSIVCPWIKTSVYDFTGGTDGWGPRAFVFQSGNIYGTAAYGANPGCAFSNGCGVVFQLTRSNGTWTESTLHSFTGGSDGGNPDDSSVNFDSAGNLYGTALIGGVDCGTIFQLASSGSGWTFNVLHTFTGGGDGGGPYSGLRSDGAGHQYGTTFGGSTFGACGGANATVFELSSDGSSYTPIYAFSCSDCGSFRAPLPDASGNLWGTAEKAGAHGYGMVFELTYSNGSWTFHDMHDFTGGTDGAYPIDLAFDANGNTFGVAAEGGNQGCNGVGCGVIWEITP